jgi:hypothetical protein
MAQRGTSSPLHGAFTFTTFAAVFLITGSLGYEIKKSGGVPYLRWTDGVVWEQIWWGVGTALIAAVLWTVSLRRLKRDPLPTGMTRSSIP